MRLRTRPPLLTYLLGSRHSRHHYKVKAGNALSITIAKGALQVTNNKKNNFQHMLFKRNCSISIRCAMLGSVACKHKTRQGLHQPAGRPAGRPANRPEIVGDPPPSPPPWSLSLPKTGAAAHERHPTA